MKITTLSAVLCLAATTVLADKKNTVASNAQDLSIALSAADKRESRHHEINGVSVAKRADGPKGVIRHENQGKKGKKRHNEHGVEAHNDGGNRYRDRGSEGKKSGNDDTEEEKKGGSGHASGDEKNVGGRSSGKKQGGGGEKDGKDNEDMKGGADSGDMKGGADSGDMKGGADAGDKKGGADSGDKKGGEGDKKGGENGGEKLGEKDPANGDATPAYGGGDDKSTTGGDATPAAGGDDKAVTTPAAGEEGKGATNPSVPRDYSSPLWLVQPIGSSVWAQGTTYVISWGPNPDPVYAKALSPKSLVDIRLMQGPPTDLKEIAVLSSGMDSSIHKIDWLVPTTVTPATDYSIRMTHEGDVDSYSHYFEVVKAGDPRSNKSNVGEPLQMPQKGDMPDSLHKEPTKPASPPNPLPSAPSKPAAAPAAAKPVVHASSAHSETHQGANMLALAMALFGAVYFL
ncbi:hypothetical protein BGZ96_003604 [Linnemannia gamsii]|uniref:Yeast cell wall synthesis Kre9/Knh1-like N-terminal domain-containing protein n=1 Tax=Linnemannia gamsii TaxID=64522 RepID=A0ABQ7K6P7_9FUNG|nr:hypothetical protein BGZ96_003604 [Linnemannia gamsii]